MGKSVLQIRHGLYQQVILLLIGILWVSPLKVAAQDSSPTTVFRDKQPVGRLDSVAGQPCEGCYTIHRHVVFGKEIQIRVPVSVVSVNGTKKYSEDYTIEEQTSDNKKTLVVQNNNTSENFRFVFSGKHGGRLLSVQKTVNASYHHRIAKDDYVDVPSTQICRKEFIKGVKAIPQVIDFGNFDMLKENTNDCFNCPTDLSVEECLKKKKSKVPFKWKQP